MAEWLQLADAIGGGRGRDPVVPRHLAALVLLAGRADVLAVILVPGVAAVLVAAGSAVVMVACSGIEPVVLEG